MTIATEHRTPAIVMASDSTASINGAMVLIRTLLDLGIDTVFGYPGGAVLPLYDALHT